MSIVSRRYAYQTTRPYCMTPIRNNSDELSDKRALVTGGTKGIGEAIVKRLRLSGATVMTTARSQSDGLQALGIVHPIRHQYG